MISRLNRFSYLFPAVLMCLIVSVPAKAVGDDEEIVSTIEGNNDESNEIPKLTSSGSCLAAGLCCKGRDSSCVVQRAPPNSIIEELDDIPCYCDHGCVQLHDCCPDYRTACGVQDCQVSKWGDWSVCDAECGLGTMSRTRSIEIHPRNGGQPCLPLIQQRGCRGTNCKKHQKLPVEDTAILLPIQFSSTRRVNESLDITRHLKSRYPRNPDKERAKPYCVEFQVIRSSRACKSLESFMGLREGTPTCVFCEKDAQKAWNGFKCSGTGGHEIGHATRFFSLREPACFGRWRHISSGPNCPCAQGPQFIFV